MRILSLAVVALGVSAFMAQVTLMRELLAALSGNELIFGVVLGNWMLLTGIGAALGRTAPRWRSPLALLVLAQIAVATLPIADVLAVRTLRNAIFIRGAEIGAADAVVATAVLLAPYCIVLGYVLTLSSWIVGRRQGPAGIGRVYFLDNLGSVLGGLAFSFVLVRVLGHFGILYVPAALNLLCAALVAAAFRRRRLLTLVIVVAGLTATVAATVDLDECSTRIQFAPQQVAFHGQSPYGQLVVTETAGQYNFIANGALLFSTHSREQVEETVHYAMAQRPKARRVLLISGGVSGTVGEVLKYPVEAVDYVEIDPLVLDVARRFLPQTLADPRLHVLVTDGRLHVRQTTERYDVVILDLPDPSTSQLNRFYTREFFAEVRRSFAPDGVLSLALGQSYDGYMDPELGRLLATTGQTLGDVFSDVLVIPGGRIFFLASDGPLTRQIAERLEGAGIATRLLSRSYLAAMLSPGRMADVGRALATPAPVNRDFSPILYYYHLRYWMSQFKVRLGLLEAALAALLIAYLVRIRPVPLAVFTTGLAASALEVVLLVAFQILYGSVYHQVGIIVTMFMLGLGIGSYATARLQVRRPRRALVWLLAILAVYAAALPGALAGLDRLDQQLGAGAARVAIAGLTLVLGLLVATAFLLATKLDFQDTATTASRLYTADYLGASLGALWVSTLLIPLFGVSAVCLMTAGLAVLSAAVLGVNWR